jgi:RNA polymerase sigma-70 factor (ECF subfamily)
MRFTCQRPFFCCEENALVARARERDADAFTALVNEHYRRIYRLAKRIMQNDQDAEDVLQETFLKAYEHLASFEGNSKFSTWITRIAINEALMKLRRRRKRPTVSLDELLDPVVDMGKREVAVWNGNPEEQYSQREIQLILEQAMESLRPNCRTVFLLCDVEEFSLEETAETLGISIPATKSRLFRARMALREKLTRRFKRRRAETSSFAENAA